MRVGKAWRIIAVAFDDVGWGVNPNPQAAKHLQDDERLVYLPYHGHHILTIKNSQMGVSKNRGGPPKWMVYNGKHY